MNENEKKFFLESKKVSIVPVTKDVGSQQKSRTLTTQDNKHRAHIIVTDAVLAFLFYWILPKITGWQIFLATVVWVSLSVFMQKLSLWRFRHVRRGVATIVFVNIFIFIAIYFLFWAIGHKFPIGFWTTLLPYLAITLVEIFFYSLYQIFFVKKVVYQDEEILEARYEQISIEEDTPESVRMGIDKLIDAIKEEFPANPGEWKRKNNGKFGRSVRILTSPDIEELEELKDDHAFKNILNISTFNAIRRINLYFIKVNELLPQGGIFVTGGMVSDVRKQVIMEEYPKFVGGIVYFFDFCWNRMCPKMNIFKKIYFAVTKGQHRVFPRPEIMGRLYSCGFEILSEQIIGNRFFVVARKVKAPLEDNNPSYGPLIRLRRVGKDGKLIGVYKFRTMHAYSEYLQPYIYAHNHLQSGGKIADDYRVSTVGKFLRRCWLDELPMIFNIFRGDLKLVGVRPLSQHYFGLYTPEMQELRTKVRPGLLPPFYVDMPETLEEVQESERKYIEQYLEHPFRTDWKYFWKIVGNIVFRRKRSA